MVNEFGCWFFLHFEPYFIFRFFLRGQGVELRLKSPTVNW